MIVLSLGQGDPKVSEVMFWSVAVSTSCVTVMGGVRSTYWHNLSL